MPCENFVFLYCGLFDCIMIEGESPILHYSFPTIKQFFLMLLLYHISEFVNSDFNFLMPCKDLVLLRIILLHLEDPAESSCGKIHGEFGIRVCTPVRERQGRKKGILHCFRLGKILSDIDVGERLLICGDMNGHVGAEVDGFRRCSWWV